MNIKILLPIFLTIFSISAFAVDPQRIRQGLMDAVKAQNFEMLDAWLSKANPNDLEMDYLFDPLRHAAFEGHDSIFGNLLGRASDQFIKKNGEALIGGFFSYWDPHKKWGFAFSLLNRGVNHNVVDALNKGLLHHAVEDNRADCVASLIGLGVNIDALDNQNDTPLYAAVVHKFFPIALLLLEAGASIEPVDNYLVTPLHWVIMEECEANVLLAKLFIEFGADPYAKDQAGNTPFDYAKNTNKYELIKLFSDWTIAKNKGRLSAFKANLKNARLGNAAPKSSAPSQNLPVHRTQLRASTFESRLEDHLDGAIYINDINSVQRLLQKNPDAVNKTFNYGNTALHLAVEQNRPELVKILLQYKSRVDVKNDKGETARGLAKIWIILSNIIEDHLMKLDSDVLTKTYFAKIPANIFILRSKGLLDAEISFKEKEIIFTLQKGEKASSPPKEFHLLFTTQPNTVDNKIVFTKTGKKPLIFTNIKTHDKKNNPIPGCIWFVGNLTLQKEEGQLYLSGKLNMGGAFKWKLEGHPIAKNEEDSTIKTSISSVDKKGDEASVEKIKNPKVYPTKEQVAGTYHGTVDQIAYVVKVPEFEEDLPYFFVSFVTKKEQKNLWVIAHRDPTKTFVTNLEPVCDGTFKLAKDGQTTFDGKRAKKRDGSGLRFKSLIKFSDLGSNQPLSLSVETHRGMLVLTKQEEAEQGMTLKKSEEEHQEEARQYDNENDNVEQEVVFQDLVPDALEINLDVDDLLVLPNEVAAPARQKRSQKTKKRNITSYTVEQTNAERKQFGRIGPSPEEEEKARRDFEILRSKMIEVGRRNQAEENEKIWGKTESQTNNHTLAAEHNAERPKRLNPESLFTANPLYPPHDSDDYEDKVWFANGWISRNGEPLRQNAQLNFALSLKNFNELLPFAPDASWCSLFTRELGENNFQHGMNVHCSYHNNGEKKYFNISHFGLFQIAENKEKSGYLLYKIPQPDDKERIVYVLHPFSELKGKYKAGNKKLNPLESALRFVGCTYDVAKVLAEYECKDRRENIALDVQAKLLQRPFQVRYRNSYFNAVFDPNAKGQLITMEGKPWRKIEHWSVQMINDDLAFVSILFLNNQGCFEAITTKIENR
jgi:ankyrin repeat protein